MARIVGTGAVRVFPVMTGFKKSVSQEMSGSGSQGAKKFTDSLNCLLYTSDAADDSRV